MGRRRSLSVIAIVILTLTFLTTAEITPVASQASIPTPFYGVLLYGMEEANLTSGQPFTLGIFSYYFYNSGSPVTPHRTVILSVTHGSITPSTIILDDKGHWAGQVTVYATGSLVINARDEEGYTGSSHNLFFNAPSPIQTPSPSPAIPEFPATLATLLLFALVISVSGVLKKKGRFGISGENAKSAT